MTTVPPEAPQGSQEAPKRELASVHAVTHNFPTKEEWSTLALITKTFIDGGATPKGIDTAPKMMVILQAAREIGLSPIEALNSLYFVNGKVAMYGEAVPTQIYRAGHQIEWGECNARTATVTITRGDTGKSLTTTFTMEQAEVRGYTRNEIYRKFPENMLKWRALSMTAKFICPDALKGIGIKEDMEAEVIEGGRFANEKDAARIKGEVKDGTYSKRKSFKKASTPGDAPASSGASEDQPKML